MCEYVCICFEVCIFDRDSRISGLFQRIYALAFTTRLSASTRVDRLHSVQLWPDHRCALACLLACNAKATYVLLRTPYYLALPAGDARRGLRRAGACGRVQVLVRGHLVSRLEPGWTLHCHGRRGETLRKRIPNLKRVQSRVCCCRTWTSVAPREGWFCTSGLGWRRESAALVGVCCARGWTAGHRAQREGRSEITSGLRFGPHFLGGFSLGCGLQHKRWAFFSRKILA